MDRPGPSQCSEDPARVPGLHQHQGHHQPRRKPQGLSDSPAGSIMVAEALWICKQEENTILKPGHPWATKHDLLI